MVLETKTKLDDPNLPRENLEVQPQDTVRLLKAWKRCSYCGNENLKTIVLTPNGEIVCQKCGTVNLLDATKVYDENGDWVDCSLPDNFEWLEAK